MDTAVTQPLAFVEKKKALVFWLLSAELFLIFVSVVVHLYLSGLHSDGQNKNL